MKSNGSMVADYAGDSVVSGSKKKIHSVDEGRFHENEMVFKLKEIEDGGEYMIAGETDISDEVIGAIAATAAREIEGVGDIGTSSIRRTMTERMGRTEKRARGISIEAGKKEAIVDLSVKVVYGYSIPQVIVDLRKRVAARLLETCGLIAKEVNVHIVGIEFPNRMPGLVE